MRMRTIDGLEPQRLSVLVHEALSRHHSKEKCTDDVIASMPGEGNCCMSTARDPQLKKEGSCVVLWTITGNKQTGWNDSPPMKFLSPLPCSHNVFIHLDVVAVLFRLWPLPGRQTNSWPVCMISRNTNVPIGLGFLFFIDLFLISSFGARLVCVEVLLRVIYATAHLCRWNPPWPGFSYRTSGPQDSQIVWV